MRSTCAVLCLIGLLCFCKSTTCFSSNFDSEIDIINALTDQYEYHEAQQTALSLLELDITPDDKITITETLVNAYFSEKNYTKAIQYLKILENLANNNTQKIQYTAKIADTYYTDKKYSFAAIYYKYLHQQTDNDEYLFKELCALIKINAYNTIEKKLNQGLTFHDQEIEIKSWVNISLYLLQKQKLERLFFYLHQLIYNDNNFYNTEYSAQLVYIFSQCLLQLGSTYSAKKLLSTAIAKTKISNYYDISRLYFTLLDITLNDHEFHIASKIERELKFRFPWIELDCLRFYIKKYFYDDKFYESYFILNNHMQYFANDQECRLLHLFLKLQLDLISLEDFQHQLKYFESIENLAIKTHYLHARALKRWNQFQEAKNIYSEIISNKNCTHDTTLACQLQKLKCDLAVRKYAIPLKLEKQNIVIQQILKNTNNKLLKYESFYTAYLWNHYKNKNKKTLQLMYQQQVLNNFNKYNNSTTKFWLTKIYNAFQ